MIHSYGPYMAYEGRERLTRGKAVETAERIREQRLRPLQRAVLDAARVWAEPDWNAVSYNAEDQARFSALGDAVLAAQRVLMAAEAEDPEGLADKRNHLAALRAEMAWFEIESRTQSGGTV